MKRLTWLALALALATPSARMSARQAADQTAALVTKAQSVVDLMAAQDFGKVTALFDDVMRGAMPESKLREAWAALTLQVGAFKQRRSATSQPRGQYVITKVTCQFERTDLDVQIVFNPTGLVAGLAFLPVTAEWTAPSYATPSAYTESDRTVGAEGWPLAGTLTMPTGAGPFPAVVLVHGSGPSDRDETIGPNKPFKDLAVGLATRGVAVLRYEKRTQTYAGKLAGNANFTVKDEEVDDAVAAVAKLRKEPTIDPKRVFVLGHSLGGTVVPRIAAADPAIAGAISLAGATRQIADAMVAQVNYLVTSAGPVTAEGQKQIDDVVALAATVRALTPADAASPKSIGGAPAAYWLDLRAYDPVEAAHALTTPILILQGERDYQVTLAEDFAAWKKGLGSRPNVTFKSYPALNHLFIAGTGKSLPSEYGVASHVDETVVRDIAQWVLTTPGVGFR